LAGISPSTVSRVINRRGYISEDTIQKVQEAIQVLGYKPHWAARGLKGLPTRLVGLVIPDLSNVFYTAVAQSTAKVLNELKYEMILCVNDEDPEKDLNYLNILEEKCVDGIIYTHPVHGSNSETLRDMVARGMPVVEINRQCETDLLDAVLADNLRGAQQVTDYLLGKGHRRIALITGHASTTTGGERILGYQTSMTRMGLQVENELLKAGEFSFEWGEQATRELVNLDHPPTAIFATSNRISLGSLKALNESNFHIPDDISFVSFDDAEWLASWNPPITAVDIAIDEMAKLAVQLLHRRMTGSSQKPVTYHLGTTLVVRQSCRSI
jgi:DNA-binding LacI/PurR family transcriptional regulator